MSIQRGVDIRYSDPHIPVIDRDDVNAADACITEILSSRVKFASSTALPIHHQ
jgi:hypothetical protein